MNSLFEPGLLESLMPPIAVATERVGERLLRRVQHSVSAHQGYRTLRREQHHWLPVAPGLREHRLREDAGMRVSLCRLDAGACWYLPPEAAAAELLVVQGSLQASGRPGGDALAAEGYVVLDRAISAPPWVAAEPTLLYLRSRLRQAPALPALEAHWWQLAARQAGQPRRHRWRAATPGVQIMPLCGDATVTSMLVRFEAGAAVPDHRHALDEDCLVLAGEMFLGDILLRPLDYQLAPAGGGHFGEASDVGVTFFFHGALDPVLLG